jgi:hypothetical protein
MLTNLTKSIKALLLLFFIISANFLGVSFNCELQDKFKNNTIVSNFIIFGIIYFSINLSYHNSEDSPLTILRFSLYIYILFLLLAKQSFITFVINILLICAIYILTIQIEYEKNKNIYKNIDFYSKSIDYLEILLFATLCIGFYHKFEEVLGQNPNINLVDYIFKLNYCQ